VSSRPFPTASGQTPSPSLRAGLIGVLLAFCVTGPGLAGVPNEALNQEPSAFLRSLAGSPVHWMTWGEPAFARARTERKPIFLFMGYATSELSRAMAQQTFANAKTSDWLNQHFVCVAIDREDRPDLAALYQAYIEDVRQASGWPLNLWLTPELVPFDGAAYLSPSEEWGAPGFLKEAKQALDAWEADPGACRKRAAETVNQLRPATKYAQNAWSPERSEKRLAAGAHAWRDVFDAANGGFGDPPRMPEPELIRFLFLRQGADRDEALKTLRALAASAVRDPLDGGFFRYATDIAWHIPYAQKTLADQGRIALAYLEAAQGADAASFEQCARGALDFALSRLGRGDGTFAASLDATAPAFAGTYVWTAAEIEGALGPEAAGFDRAHGVEAAGNVTPADDPSGAYAGKNFLRSVAVADPAEAAQAARLLAVRDKRPAPQRDDRATVGAQGLMLAALSRAGTQLHEPRYAAAAKRTYGALRGAFVRTSDGDLGRMDGSAETASPCDYAAFAYGCRAYAQAAGSKAAGDLADRLLARLDVVYFDPVTRRYFAAAEAARPGLFVRPYAVAEPLAPESLALFAVPAPDRARNLAGGLLDSLDEGNVQAPGEQLLALIIYAGGQAAR
jgi:uncharacterized protein YyaL (SSP411 family)